MKYTKMIFLLFFLMGAIPMNAQLNIKAGIGYEQVKIGMKYKAFIEILGTSSESRSEADERLNYTDNGYDPAMAMPFILGFDAVEVYTNNNEFGIWKAYFKKGKLIYLNLSSYLSSIEVSKNITINDSLHFFQSVEQMESLMGKSYVKAEDLENYTTYTYSNLGIRFLFEGTKLRGVYLFKALKGKKALRLNSAISPASA